MPALVDNIVTEDPDGTTVLVVTPTKTGRPIKLTIDNCMAAMVRGRQWCWCKTLRRCYTMKDGKRWYLSQFVAEAAAQWSRRARHVRFLNGELDFRIESLDIRYEGPCNAAPQTGTLTSMPTPRHAPLSLNHVKNLQRAYDSTQGSKFISGFICGIGTKNVTIHSH